MEDAHPLPPPPVASESNDLVGPGVPPSRGGEKGDRLQAMHASHAATLAKQEQHRSKLEPEYTFKPQTNASPHKATVGQTEAVHTRLYSDGAGKQARLSLKKEQQLQKELEETQGFQPDTSLTRSSSYARKAVSDLHKPRRMSEKGEEESYSFKPATDMSKEMTEQLLKGKDRGSVVDRLYTAPEALAANRVTLETKKVEKELQDCTFTPRLISTASDAPRSDTPVHDRLYQHAGQVMSRRQRRKSEVEAQELKECTFSPNISGSATKAGGTPVKAGGSVPVHERLHQAAKQKQEEIKYRESMNDPACTFQPKTNQKERPATARASRVDRMSEMYEQGKQAQHARSKSPADACAAIRAREEEEELALCTFEPALETQQSKSQSQSPKQSKSPRQPKEKAAAPEKAPDTTKVVVDEPEADTHDRSNGKGVVEEGLAEEVDAEVVTQAGPSVSG
ncbi:unnamed protein product [Chrysoparadoxa australica]